MVAVPTCDVAAGAGDVFRDEGAPGLGGTAGFGVCLVPALTALEVAGTLDGIELYATDHGDRRTVAIIADQYLRLSPYKNLIEALKAAGRSLVLPPILPMPKVMVRAEVVVEA